MLLGALVYGVTDLLRAQSVPEPNELSTVRSTAHFTLRSDLDGASLEHQARVFEAFHAWFSERYFPAPEAPPLKVYLFSTRQGYSHFCRRFRRSFTDYGFYVAKDNVVVLNHQRGLGTATHELVHHFIHRSFARAPPEWVNEGFAAFFEKILGHFDEQGRLVLSVGYFNPWRFEQTKAQQSQLDLTGLARSDEVNQSAARSVMLFLHQRGKLTPFIKALAAETNDPDGLRTLERVVEKPIADIDAEWKSWIAAQPLNDEVKLLPLSFVKTPAEWQKWWGDHQTRLRYDEVREKFVPIPESGATP